ncbi:MAG: D-alanyl-D-alanine carboxypeptidase [Ruminococcaceae bacterium]|nr:D-alanyl-D-alanine carboxypeptidase [Oscillospiraceae bacterium]
MLKRTFFILFSIFLCLVAIFSPITASAYEVTGFDITAKAGMLVSMDTGEILYENNIDEKIYPASITKIMTTMLILESEKYNPEEKITLTKEALDLVLGTGSSVSHMKQGEEFTQLDLVHLVLMASYGDTTYLAAQYYGGSVENFVAMMNQKAAELGLTSTHYVNPVGLHDDEHYTTVRDIYKLTLYALKNETFKKVCETPRYTMAATNFSPARTLSTTNFLQDTTTNYYYQYAKGVKTGFTDEAGRCLVSTASYKGYNYMCILTGCPNDGRGHQFKESANLYRWAFNNFSFKEIANSNEPVCEMPVELSFETDFVPLYFKEPFVSVLPNEADDSTIVVETHLNSESTEAPIKKGDVLGKADVIYAEKIIGTVDLVAGEDVKASKILIAFEFIKEIFTSIYIKLLLGLVFVVIIIFVILCIRLNIGKFKKRKVKYIPYNRKEK